MNNYDEILDCIFGLGQIINEQGPSSVNIEDIKQTLMQGHFVMFMLCNIENSNTCFQKFQTLLKDECSKMDMEVWIQRKEIFDCMHNIG